MELTFHWFWLISGFAATLAIFAAYKAIYIHNFESKFWNVFFITLVILGIINPIKMDVDTKAVTDRTNQHIAEAKVLPPLIKDNSFKQSTNVEGITQKDLK